MTSDNYSFWFAASNLLAIILVPFLTLSIQNELRKREEVRSRRLSIFRTLMATRGDVLSVEHVTALNLIEIEFHNGGKKCKEVINHWLAYKDHLGQLYTESTFEMWVTTKNNLLFTLLGKMSSCLNYEFTTTDIKNNGYLPVGHERIAAENNKIRAHILAILNNGAIPVEIKSETDVQTNPPNDFMTSISS